MIKSWAGILDCILTSRIMYLRVADYGPRLGLISKSSPLIDSYFTRLDSPSLAPDESMLANNGWIWNADPLINFAGKESKAYLLRQVIVWGDCVKLNYGDCKEDNPWLWNHMAEYTKLCVRLFNGLRIDNCHSTPLHVAEYLLDVARRERNDVYVFAELFTGSEETDVVFCARLGIHSLIREGMNANDPGEMTRYVQSHGGTGIGSFHRSGVDSNHGSRSVPHALFMDCTHDNESPNQKRTAADTLPHAAIVGMSACAVGSVKGFDEIVPEGLDVVREKRGYRVGGIGDGIGAVKKLVYEMHVEMAKDGMIEINVGREREYVTVHRVHPLTHEGVFMIARTAYNDDVDDRGAFVGLMVRSCADSVASTESRVDSSIEPTCFTNDSIDKRETIECN
jgi:glycogen debranching enzyme